MTIPNRVVVTGATGVIGKALCHRLRERGCEVVVFSRNPEAARAIVPGAARYVRWSPAETGSWAEAIDGAHAVVSLAGAPIIGKRWSPRYKGEIRESRSVGTRGLVEAMERARVRPRVFVSASAIGYYGLQGDDEAVETTPPGADFLAQVCQDWEREAVRAEALGVRTAVVRTGIVLNAEEGPVPRMLPLFRLFLGGPILPGNQPVSWIHLEDEVGILLLALEDERASGPVNATAPEPATQRQFAAELGRRLGRPSWLPVPGFLLQVAMGEVAIQLTGGRRVFPRKALELGYRFRHPTLESALRQILDS